MKPKKPTKISIRPTIVSGRLCGRMVTGVPSGRKRPMRGPRLIRMPSVAKPAIMCTHPAAPTSWNPSLVSIQPAPCHPQAAPMIHYRPHHDGEHEEAAGPNAFQHSTGHDRTGGGGEQREGPPEDAARRVLDVRAHIVAPRERSPCGVGHLDETAGHRVVQEPADEEERSWWRRPAPADSSSPWRARSWSSTPRPRSEEARVDEHHQRDGHPVEELVVDGADDDVCQSRRPPRAGLSTVGRTQAGRICPTGRSQPKLRLRRAPRGPAAC